jgi:hypothetical protein
MKSEQKQTIKQVDLEFRIDEKSFQTTQQYWTGRELKSEAEIPLTTPLYLSISRPYQDELVENDARVNLARPEIEYFYVRKKLQFSVNGASFTWYKQFITGIEIRELASISSEHVLFLDIKGDWEDDQIVDNEIVDLARPGKEHFFSKAIVVDIILIVNGRDRSWTKRSISFDEVIGLKGDGVDYGSKAYTVTYTNGPKANPSGEMAKGDSVVVKDRMKFYVTATDKS